MVHQKEDTLLGVFFLVSKSGRDRTHFNAARMRAAGEGSTEPLHDLFDPVAVVPFSKYSFP